MQRFYFVFVYTLLLLSSCNNKDNDYIPYNLKGIRAWVYTSENSEYFVNYFDISYENRDAGLAKCESIAKGFATDKKFSNWSYACCTVTPSSDCSTKVR